MRATVTKLANPATRQIRHLRTHQRIYRVVLERRLHTRLRGNGGPIQAVRGNVSLLDHAASSIIRISARTQGVHKLSAQTISIISVGQLIAASLIHVRGAERLRNLCTEFTALTDQTAQTVIRLDGHHGSTKRINAHMVISRHRTARRITLHTVQQRTIHRMGTGNTVTVITEGMYSTITVSAGQQTTGSIIGRGSAHTQRIRHRQNIAQQVILVAGNTTGRVHHGGNVTRLVITVMGHTTGTISHRNHLGSGIIGERTSAPLVIADALHAATRIPGVEHRRSHTGTGNGQHTTARVIANARFRAVTVHLANQTGISVVLVASHRLLSSAGSLIGCSQSTARIVAVLGHTTCGGNHAHHLVRTVVLVAAQTALSVQNLHGVTRAVINHRGDSRVVSICTNLRTRILGENLGTHRAAQVVARDTHAVNTIIGGEGLARGINGGTYTHAGRVNQRGQGACGIILASPHTTGGVNGADQAHQTIVGVVELRATRQGNAVNITVRIKGTLHAATQRVNHGNNIAARTVFVLGTGTCRIHRSHQSTASSVLKTPAGAIRVLTADHVTGRIIGELSFQPKSRNNLHQVARGRVLATGQLLLSVTNTGQQTIIVILKGDSNALRAHHTL